jgi:hypothetical protein
VQRREYLRANAGIADAGEIKTNMTIAKTATCATIRSDPCLDMTTPDKTNVGYQRMEFI